MLQDIRFALRMIATHRWFSVAVIVTLALGIGINTTVFTLGEDSVKLGPLKFEDSPDRQAFPHADSKKL